MGEECAVVRRVDAFFARPSIVGETSVAPNLSNAGALAVFEQRAS
jgi:hypothetical protein